MDAPFTTVVEDLALSLKLPLKKSRLLEEVPRDRVISSSDCLILDLIGQEQNLGELLQLAEVWPRIVLVCEPESAAPIDWLNPFPQLDHILTKNGEKIGSGFRSTTC